MCIRDSLLHVSKTINPKAIALIAHAYLDKYALFGNTHALKQACAALNWLQAHANPHYSGPCWGYPFDWDNRTFIPAGTPSSVVTAIAVEAFLRAYEITKEDQYLTIAKGCALFITQDLNIDRITEEKCCFSYTPLDNWHVHNANLFSCATLARIAYLTQSNHWDDLIYCGTNYTLRAQRTDGAWYYWGVPDREYMVDHYHTGFVLRCLNTIARTVNVPGIMEAIKHGYTFYRKHLFISSGLPKRTENEFYPIDIHSCAEAIICLTTLHQKFPTGLPLAQKIATWAVKKMQHSDGHFYYRRYPYLTIRIPFVRWSQAWMLRALSCLLLAQSNSNI